MSVADGDDDEAFLLALEQAEAAALDSSKRRRLSTTSSSSTPSTPPATPEGPYLAALKGSHSSTWKEQSQGPGYAHKQPYGSKPLAAGTSGAQVASGACFKCGDPGHWARDCPQSVPNPGGGGQIGGGSGGGGGYVNVELKVEDKACPCGAGTCLVLTSNTLKNPGRRFYKCPMRDGGCNFFEWCDAPSPAPANARNNMGLHSETSATDMLCPCGAGTCLILTTKTGKNVGRQFFRCPLNQGGGSCGFFKWCDEQQPRVGAPLQASPQYQADSMSSMKTPIQRSSSSCFKCGQDDHWARDCPNQSADHYPDKGGRPITSGSSAQYKADSMSSIKTSQRSSSSCFKCGQDDHWARDCPNQSSDPYPDKGGRPMTSSSSPGACYNCGRAGHWSRDCPASNSGGGGGGGTGTTSRAKSSSALRSWNSQRY